MSRARIALAMMLRLGYGPALAWKRSRGQAC